MPVRMRRAYVAPSGMNVTVEASGDGHVFRLTPALTRELVPGAEPVTAVY